MADTEACLAWFGQRQGKVTYSMGSRMGPNSYDCSSSVYLALIAGGWFPPGKMGNTDTLFSDLEAAGWKAASSPVRGDVFIWGARGASGGAAGHTGMFVNKDSIIHCNGGANGISTNKYSQSHQYAGSPPAIIYHHSGNNAGSTTQRKTYSEKENNVIIMHKELKSKGYSLQAIAAKAGNADAESGLKPNVSELGGGPGYGIYQWTSPNASESGKAYVTRLMQQAGISGGADSMLAQVKLGDWGMTNGQWIGVIDPKTVAGFKAGTDVNQLTLAFLRNFERAGIERLQDRQSAANQWYNFLVQYEKNPETVELPGVEEAKKELKSAGELEEFGIKDGSIFAKGWHFSSWKPNQSIQVIDATNDKVLQTITVAIKTRNDIKEKYSDVEDVEKCGFEISFKVKDGQAIYLKGIRSSDSDKDELVFDQTLLFEPAENAEINDYAKTNEKFWFEIIEFDRVKARGNKTLASFNWSNALMEVPTTDILLPINYANYVIGREEIKIYVNNKVFHGIVDGYDKDYVTGILSVNLVHIIDEWRFRQLSTNLACKNRTINDIYSTYDFRYSKKWRLDFLQNVANRRIDYVYSRQTKLEGLTKTCDLTDDVFWRVGFRYGRLLEIGTFGEKKPYTLSLKPSSQQNIRILEEPVVVNEISDTVNMATVYGEKSDSGMSSMSLREVYLAPRAQKKGFPVRILKNGINNERGYDYVNYTKLASNNNVEYTVIDEESLKMESNVAIEDTFSFNDLAPFSTDGKTISDEDRAKASNTAYEAAIKRLKQKRRNTYLEFSVEELPADINVGDRIRFLYDRSQLNLEECTEYMRNLIEEDDWFYLTDIEYSIDSNRMEVDHIRISKMLRTERDGS